MKFNNQQKIFLTQRIKEEMDKVITKPLTGRDKLILRAIADAIINLPATDDR